MKKEQNNNGKTEYLVPAYPIVSDQFSFSDLWALFLKNLRIMIITTFIVVVGSVVYALILPPMYQSQVLMVSSQENNQISSRIGGQLGALSSLAGVNIGGSSSANDLKTGLAILQSRKFINEFINENELKPKLFPDQWNDNTKKWDDDLPPSDWDAFDVFINIYTVDYFEFSGPVITLTLEWFDPKLASKWANLLVEKLNQYTKKTAILESDGRIAFLEKELVSTNIATAKQILFQMIEQQMNTKMLANTSDEYSLKVIDPAVPAQKKHKPQRRFIVLIGVFLGFAMSCIVVILKELFLGSGAMKSWAKE